MVTMTTEVEIPDTTVEPVILERGRYALAQYQGYLEIHRAAPLCERCLSCGCGEQQEVLDTSPAGLIKFADMVGVGGGMMKTMMKMLKMGGNGNGE